MIYYKDVYKVCNTKNTSTNFDVDTLANSKNVKSILQFSLYIVQHFGCHTRLIFSYPNFECIDILVRCCKSLHTPPSKNNIYTYIYIDREI